jgi:hypothetical protein
MIRQPEGFKKPYPDHCFCSSKTSQEGKSYFYNLSKEFFEQLDRTESVSIPGHSDFGIMS